MLITRGLLNSSLVHPREVFRAAIAEAAAGIIVVHNHPERRSDASAEDRAVTRQLVSAGQLLDLPRVRSRDHCRRPFRELRRGRTAVTGTLLPDTRRPDLRAVLERHADRLDLELIERALRFSASAHRGQKRMSGEDFVSHSIAVALILAEQLLDSTIDRGRAAARRGGGLGRRAWRTSRASSAPRSPGIVDGLTKISSLTFRSSAEEQVENYRKLLLSIAKDARVIIIKLGDRLHNMRTLEHLPPERRSRIALETREIYAPLAHRFGMAGIKAELEDLAFKFLEPEEYRELAQQVAAKRAAREQTILKLKTPLEYELQRGGHRLVRGHRPAQAPLVDLPEDEEAGQGVRRDLRPHGGAGHRPVGAGLLPRARHHPPQLDADPGADQGLHREPQVERVPVAPHHDLRSGRPALRGADPHPGDAPHGRVRHRGALGLQARRQRPTSWTSTWAGSASCWSCSRTRTARRSSSSS